MLGSSRAPERGGPCQHCLAGNSLLLAGHRKDARGPDDCWQAGRGGAPGVQDALLGAEPGAGGADGRPLGAQTCFGVRGSSGTSARRHAFSHDRSHAFLSLLLNRSPPGLPPWHSVPWQLRLLRDLLESQPSGVAALAQRASGTSTSHDLSHAFLSPLLNCSPSLGTACLGI